MKDKIQNQENSYNHIKNGASFLILSNITLMLFVGDKNNFKKNDSSLSILYVASILSIICIFISIYILINLSRYVKNNFTLLNSEKNAKKRSKNYNNSCFQIFMHVPKVKVRIS